MTSSEHYISITAGAYHTRNSSDNDEKQGEDITSIALDIDFYAIILILPVIFLCSFLKFTNLLLN